MEYVLDGMDLADVRFAISPINELTLSLRTWRDPGRYPGHLPWLRATQSARESLDGDVLRALVDDRLWTPDYLSPRPRGPLTRIDDELDTIAATPDDVLLADLARLHPEGRPPALRGPASVVRQRVLDALTGYWEACFVPHWPRMRAVLQADVVHRGALISRHGVGRMFSGLSERVTYDGGVVTVRLTSHAMLQRAATTGVGLTLVPTLFTRGASCPISAEEPPTIMYGARGIGTLWQTSPRDAPPALAGILGQVRAGLLTALDEPASSTELALRAEVSTSAVNQHLRVLRAAGLLTSARSGRSVLYLRSELGERVVDACGP
ncbi:Helix-turn-helix domain-containing protein [Paraoerskovia marina]|uniref:Helix-turn-helix domain-containing protein n=1 Tax=Paraoerskovia marina TaxID=545619 RepID=A0A1H1T188_9CELL|nr:DUF5937 family protein [Paraoerskovia marina]SDS53429.1 Helix-turn-helix domain-containing protein [Paraoerskovia marina]